jgi:hypothetical protein
MKIRIMKKALKTGVALGALFMAVACAKPPTQEVSQAEDAVNAAIQSGAEDYAADELKSAQEALADANAKMESKDYKGARISALDAKAKADSAGSLVAANKEAAKTQAAEQMAPLKADVESLDAAVSGMKGKAADPLKSDLADLTDQWTAVQSDFDAERYKSAIEKMNELRPSVDELKGKVEAAQKAPAPKAKSKKK